MFLGTYTPRLDEKGRLILPAKYREALAEGLVVTRSQERCLAIYSTETFVEMTRAIRAAPASVKQVRDYQRMLAAGASDEIPDKQGRITIPALLRSYAGLESECVVVGSLDRLEVWNPQRWDSYAGAHEDAFSQLNAEVFPED